MHERFFIALHEGMDVYDVNQDKVGTVGKVYTKTAVGSTLHSAGSTPDRPYMKVDTGFLGLGKDLYIPFDNISDVSDDRVTLNLVKDRIDAMGWDHRPDWLRDH